MKMVFQIAVGILLAGILLFVGKLFFWGWFISAMQDEIRNESPAKALSSIPQYRTVTETVKPKSLRECQAIYGNEINETIRSCMEGSILTVRINLKTGDKEILSRKKYYHLEEQNAL